MATDGKSTLKDILKAGDWESKAFRDYLRAVEDDLQRQAVIAREAHQLRERRRGSRRVLPALMVVERPGIDPQAIWRERLPHSAHAADEVVDTIEEEGGDDNLMLLRGRRLLYEIALA